MFTLAHLSDIHLSPMPRTKRRHLMSKRILGYANWHKGRKYVFRREVLDLLTSDLRERNPDHIAVTGDLINLGLPEEFPRAAEWLLDLGPPDLVTVIPGNHDAYVHIHPDQGTVHWRPYMRANEDGEALSPAPEGGFPFVRRLGQFAIVGLSSAVPTLPFVAAGRVGTAQLASLAHALDVTGRADLFRIVLIHHPPLPGQDDWRRGLRDAAALHHVLETHGAELVLHGHQHQNTVTSCGTASGQAIVVGAPSASEAVPGRKPAARYNEYAIERTGDGWRVEMTGRAAANDGTVFECERRVLRSR